MRIHENVRGVKAAIGYAEEECLAATMPVITDSKPKVSGAPEAEAHSHALDENHDDSEFVFARIDKMCCSED